LLRQGIEGKLPARREGLEEFLAPCRPEELRSFFAQEWETGRASVREDEKTNRTNKGAKIG
jgi:hypothetical protein